MKVLVTGATGFVGKALIPMLKKNRHQVISLSSKNGNIIARSTWLKLPVVETVIHLAGKVGVQKSWEEPEAFFETNFLGTLRALEYCRKNKASFVYISSFVYGNKKRQPIKETDRRVATNPYAASKILAEDLCFFYRKKYKTQIVIVRPFNLYGKGNQGLVSELISQIKKSSTIYVKNSSPQRDWLHIDDFCRALVSITSHPSQTSTYNLGAGKSISIPSLLTHMRKICKKKLVLIDLKLPRRNEIQNATAYIKKIRNEIGWFPRLSLRKGLQKTIET